MSSGPTIKSFEIITIEIPMRLSVRHSLAERSTARNILVRAVSTDGRLGWGESCPREYVTGESLDSVKQDLREVILPALLGELGQWAETQDRLTSALAGLRRDQQSAFGAAELAVLDLAGQVCGESAGNVLGPVLSAKVQYSGVVATEEIGGVQQQCTFMAKFGARQVKVKVGKSLDKNLEILTTAREILGPEVQLRIDANCAWSATEALRQLDAMAAFQLAGVEQPLPAD